MFCGNAYILTIWTSDVFVQSSVVCEFSTKCNLTIRISSSHPMSELYEFYSLLQLPPLHMAAKKGDLNEVKELVKETPANINIQDDSFRVSIKDYY